MPRKVKRCDDLDSSVQCFDKCYLQKKGGKELSLERIPKGWSSSLIFQTKAPLGVKNTSLSSLSR